MQENDKRDVILIKTKWNSSFKTKNNNIGAHWRTMAPNSDKLLQGKKGGGEKSMQT